MQEEAERTERIKQDVKEIQKVFYCELCNKQYKLASEFETHLSSYDHNHKKVGAASILVVSGRKNAIPLPSPSLWLSHDILTAFRNQGLPRLQAD